MIIGMSLATALMMGAYVSYIVAKGKGFFIRSLLLAFGTFSFICSIILLRIFTLEFF